MARQAVREMPDGRYEAEAFMDDDGVHVGVPVPIKVVVEVAGDSMTIDLSQVSPQVAGYFNSGATAGRSAAQVAFKCMTSPTHYPINEGSLRPVRVVLPPGLVISARKPAAMRWWMTYPMTVIDCVFRALADVTQRAAIAGHHADLAVVNFYGLDKRTGRFFLGSGGLSGGGWGATDRADGQSATVCINDGDTHNQPVEAMEIKYPAVVEEYSLRTDSGGPGRFRGGLGTTRSVRLLTDAKMNSFIERTRCAPWGVAGGADGVANRLRVRRADGAELHFPNGKVDGLELGAGDRYIVETGGGGGYGDPRTRPADAVLADVRAGYVSAEQARAAYGVVVVGDECRGGPYVDQAATKALRGARNP
jgi:N-methylhydantoinase B